ncbi:MAG: T9SS type A sorting domain-containing protein [Chitinophagales bacterium]
MTNFQPIQGQIRGVMFGVLFLASLLLQAQNADLSLVHVQVPDTVVLGDTIDITAYIKNNSNTNYTNNNLELAYYVNEIQDEDKLPMIQNKLIETTINIPSGDSILVEQEVIVDDLLFQIGAQQDIQKNIIIIWPVDDDYSINYHLQPIAVLKQAIPTVFYNSSSPSSEITISSTNLPIDIQGFILAEFTNYMVSEVTQQDFDDGSIQFEVKLENGDEDEVKLYFSEGGILLMTQTEVDTTSLISTITDFILDKYPNSIYFIDSVYEFLFSDGTIQYKVEVKDFADTIEEEEYFDSTGNPIAEPGILIEFYEEPDIEIGGINFGDILELETDVEVNGTLTNNLSTSYNDVVIPINYAAISFPPTIETPKLRTQNSTIDVLASAETKTFEQTVSVDEDLFYVGKNIVVVWPTDYIMNLTSNCLIQEVTVTMNRDTVGIETIAALSNDINIAPNPTMSQLNVQTKNLQIENITVYDLAAKPVEEYSLIHQDFFHTDLSHLNDGLYILYIQTDKGNTIKKLVIGH